MGMMPSSLLTGGGEVEPSYQKHWSGQHQLSSGMQERDQFGTDEPIFSTFYQKSWGVPTVDMLFKNHFNIFLSSISDKSTVTGLGRAADSNSLLHHFTTDRLFEFLLFVWKCNEKHRYSLYSSLHIKKWRKSSQCGVNAEFDTSQRKVFWQMMKLLACSIGFLEIQRSETPETPWLCF